MQHTLLEYPANLSSTIPLTILDQMMVRLLATEAGTRIDDHEQTSTQKLSGKLSPELSWMIGIDHAVLNVEAGDLPRAIAQYTQAFGFRAQQKFDIHTPRSALTSQVLSHPQGSAQFPINEPASATSQIQEFLDHNRGPGIQHIALQTGSILTTVTQLRQQGLACLQVPFAYYEQLRTRPGYALTTEQWRAIAQQQVLVDWQLDASPPALLLQIFTQPIFAEPTFFFEIIERQQVTVDHQTRIAEGFGEGNFRALFEAIEREQIKRGSLKQPHQSSHQSSKF
jgi:4-hydroxyphenylpyruvate dioxygenase